MDSNTTNPKAAMRVGLQYLVRALKAFDGRTVLFSMDTDAVCKPLLAELVKLGLTVAPRESNGLLANIKDVIEGADGEVGLILTEADAAEKLAQRILSVMPAIVPGPKFYYIINTGDVMSGGPFAGEDERELALRDHLADDAGLDDTADLVFVDINEKGEMDAFSMSLSDYEPSPDEYDEDDESEDDKGGDE